MISEEYADEPQFRMAQKRWHSFLRFSLALVAQLDRASASEAEGCWFDSSRGHFSRASYDGFRMGLSIAR